jgi:hypothetical protein
MRGKNVGKFRNDRLKSGTQADPKGKSAGAHATTYTPGAWQEANDAEATTTGGWTLITPHRIASELSLQGYGGEMQPYVLKLIHRGTSWAVFAVLVGYCSLTDLKH